MTQPTPLGPQGLHLINAESVLWINTKSDARMWGMDLAACKIRATVVQVFWAWLKHGLTLATSAATRSPVYTTIPEPAQGTLMTDFDSTDDA